MNDSQMQARASFERKCGEFIIILTLTNEKNLEIEVKNSTKVERYRQLIDQPFINNQKAFQNIFQAPTQVLNYLMHLQGQVIVEKGDIIFDYEYGGLLQRKKKKIIIKTYNVEIDEVNEAQIEVDKFQKAIATQLLQQTHKMEQIKNELAHLEKTKKKKDSKNQPKEDKAGQLESENQNLKKKLQNITETTVGILAKNSTSIKCLLEAVSNLKQKCLKMEFKPQLAKSIQPSYGICHHPDNANHQYYSLTITGDRSAKLVRQGNVGWYNFVNRTAILPKQTATFKAIAKKLHSCDHDIMGGICTSSGLGKTNDQNNSESSYYSGRQNLFVWGMKRECKHHTIFNNDVLEVEVDRIIGLVQWRINGMQVAESKIPQNLKDKPLFFSLMLYFPGSEVELFI